MTPTDLANILCRHGIIQREAIEDPEGYDGGVTMDSVARAAEEISRIQFVESAIAEIGTPQDFASELEIQSWRNHLTQLLEPTSSHTS